MSGRWGHAVGLILLVASVGLTLLWSGDVPWMIDEPRLVANAWHANHDGGLVRGGLWGNFGVRYGPLPTWTYQALLLISHEPATLAFLRALLCAGASAAAFYWLARELRLPLWFAAALLAGPLVVEFHRVLWDASFGMPLGALALAGFAAFVRTGTRGSLLATLAGALLLPTIHPQGLPLALPILGWLGWKHRPALRTHFKPIVGLLLVLALTHLPWVIEAVGSVVAQSSGSLKKGYPNGASHLACALAPFLGGNLLGGQLAFGQVWPAAASPAARAGLLLLGLIYPLAWAGIALLFRRLIQKPLDDPPRTAVAAVALTALGLQAILFGVLRIPPGPQYFFGTFALHALLAWMAVDELRILRLGPILGGAFGLTAATVSVLFAVHVHTRGFAPELGWLKLGDVAHLARALNRYAEPEVYTEVRILHEAPQALRTLRLLLPPPAGEPQVPKATLLIEQKDNGALPLLEQSAPRPAGSPLDVSPLPKGWIPANW